jgi:transposase
VGGLDVHATKVVAAIADSQSGELVVQQMSGATEQVAEFCAALPAPIRVAYEAGPTGFGLARHLQQGASTAPSPRRARSSVPPPTGSRSIAATPSG